MRWFAYANMSGLANFAIHVLFFCLQNLLCFWCRSGFLQLSCNCYWLFMMTLALHFLGQAEMSKEYIKMKLLRGDLVIRTLSRIQRTWLLSLIFGKLIQGSVFSPPPLILKCLNQRLFLDVYILSLYIKTLSCIYTGY